MAVHTEIVPSGDPALGIGLEALRLARMRMTSNAGSSYWPMGDGTGILAGQQAGDQGLVLVDQHGNRMPLIDTTEISQKADDAMSKANAAVDGMQSVRDEAVKGVKEAKDAASTAQSTAASAASKADKLATELDGTKAIVERHTTKLGEVETKVSNSVEHADQALSASTQAVQTANSVKTTADRAYNDAQSALTQSSTAVQTAGEVKTTLETNYLSKKDSDAAYASKSELKQTSDGITSTVEKTYATKSALEALRNIADNAVETWTGSQKPTASNAPASTWATDQLRKQHAGDVYYDTSTGYSYRWGSTDGKSYTWSLIKDSDITKAIADAAKAQSTANGAQQGVDRLDADIPVTYSTKSELRQTSESLTAKVTEAQRVGQNALDKATTVEQTANGLKTTVQEQAQTLKGHTTTIGQLTQKADSLTSSLTQTNQRIDSISVGARNLLAKRDMVTGWLAPENGDLIASGGHASGENIGNVTSGWIPVTAGKMMCLTLYDTFNNTANTGRYWFYKADKKAIKGVEWNPRTPGTVIFTVPAGAAWIRVTAINASNATSPRYKLETGSIPTDWTPAPEDTAQSITEAVTRTSKLEQTLDGFKTTVSQTYETKSDSLAKKTALEQSLNGFKTTVSQNYETKSDSLAKQSALEQSLNSFKSTVSSTYSTKNELDGLSAMASKTWRFWKDASTSPRRDWVRLGTLTSNGDSSSVQIDVLTGNGWNGAPYQNSRLSIMVKDSWQSSPSTSRAFGVSVLRENCQNAQVRVMALAADECEIWCYLPWQHGSGQYTISGSYKAWSNNTASQSDAPTSGTSQDVAYRLNAEQLRSDVESTYATKSSVEQTATSIKSSVSETYATKTTVQNLSTTLTQTKESLTVSIKQAQTSADTANGNAANAQSRVGSLESCIRMTSDGVRVGHIVNGGFQGYSALVSPHGSFDVLDESGRTAATFQASVIELLNGLVRLRNANNTGELLIKAPDGTYGYLSYNSDGMFLKSPDGTIRLEPKPGCNVYTRSKAIQPSQAGLCNKATDANGIISVDNLSPPDGNANNGILSVTVTPINIGQDPTLLAFTPVIWAKGVNGFQVRLKTNNNTWVSGAQPYAFCWHVVWA